MLTKIPTSVLTVNRIVARLISKQTLSRSDTAILAMITDLERYLDGRYTDTNLLRSVNAFRDFAERFVGPDADKHAEPVPPFELNEHCHDCGTVLHEDDYCPRCAAVGRWKAEAIRLLIRTQVLEGLLQIRAVTRPEQVPQLQEVQHHDIAG